MKPLDVLPGTGSSGGYWSQARQPLTSLLFVSPLLVAYEAGMVILGPEAVRNGADAWLRSFLESIGFGQYFLLPALCVGILLGWHHTTGRPWHSGRAVLAGMAIESVLLAGCLRFMLQLQGALAQIAPLASCRPSMSVGNLCRTAVSYLGAGIYEELLFRLILLSAALALLASLKLVRGRVLIAIVSTSLVFSIAHYVGPYGDTLHWFSFLFRFVAGAFFAILFLYRGFGVAVGAHAGYDLCVGLG